MMENTDWNTMIEKHIAERKILREGERKLEVRHLFWKQFSLWRMTGLHTASYPVTTNESLCVLDEENDEVGGSKMKWVKEREGER